jgi:hypothetical protein
MRNDEQNRIAILIAALIALLCGGAAFVACTVIGPRDRPKLPTRPPLVPASVAPVVPPAEIPTDRPLDA